MSHLQYYAFKGVGERNRESHRLNQAVRIGDRIECSGQVGWDPESGEVSEDLTTEIKQAFANVDLNLKDAGGKGWSQVYRVNSYHVVLNDDVLNLMAEEFAKWMPDHGPIWTCIGVKQLAFETMHIEIEVVAHDEEGARKAR